PEIIKSNTYIHIHTLTHTHTHTHSQTCIYTHTHTHTHKCTHTHRDTQLFQGMVSLAAALSSKNRETGGRGLLCAGVHVMSRHVIQRRRVYLWRSLGSPPHLLGCGGNKKKKKKKKKKKSVQM